LRAAGALARRGVARGDRVLLFLPNGLDWLRAWWGIATLGAVMVPVNTAYRGETLRHVCGNAGSRLIVTDGVLGERLERLDVPLDVVGPAELGAAAGDPPPLARPLEPWDIHAVNYTSGTTGPAKGVLTPYLATYMGGYGSLGEGGGLTPDDRWLVDLPLFHVGAQMASLSAVSVGASLALRSAFAGKEYWEVAAQTGATRSLLVGTMANFLLGQEPGLAERSHSLTDVFVAPMVADPDGFCGRFGIQRLFTAYGQTEISAPLDCPPGAPIVAGSCGRPREGVELRIVDEHDLPVAVGEVGELVIRSERPWEMNAGYLDNAEATARAWRNGWFHTGDAFRRDHDDNYFFVDRQSDTLRRRGENISSFQVELDVVAHPDVAEAACVAVAGELGEDEVKVLVVPAAGREIDLAGLIEFLVPRMPHFMVPRYVDVVDELPKTQTMRVQKFMLRQRGNSESTWDREAAGLHVTRAGLEHRGSGDAPRMDSPPTTKPMEVV
ncbi:MAG: AMP-binding protein, partial [Acidimicrobiia bacterium]